MFRENGLPKGCTNGGDCRDCPDVGALNVGCKHNESAFWVEQQVRALRGLVVTFGPRVALTQLLRSTNAHNALDLWNRAEVLG